MRYVFSVLRVIINRNVSILLISALASALVLALFSWGLPLLITKVSSITVLGIVYSIAYAISIPFNIISGTLSDYIGRKKILIVGSALNLLAVIFLLFSLFYMSILLVIASLTTFVISSVFQIPATNSLLAESVPEHFRSYAFSLLAMMTYVSATIGSYILGYLMTSNIFILLVYALLLALFSLILRFLLNETLINIEKRSKTDLRDFIKNISNVPSLFANRIYLILIFIAYASAAASITFTTFMPVFMKNKLKFNEDIIGLIYAFTNLIGIFALTTGYIVSKLSAFRALILSLILMGLTNFLLLTVRSGDFIFALLLIVTSTYASIMSQVSSNTFITEVTQPSNRGKVFSSLISVALISTAITPYIIGEIASIYIESIPLVIGILYLFSSLMLTLIRIGEKNEIHKNTNSAPR